MPLTLNRQLVSSTDDRPLHRQLAGAIRDAITTGDLLPGEALQPENTIAAAVGISRTATRDALALLVGEGLIVKRSGTVARVATPPPVRHMATSRYRAELDILDAIEATGDPHPEVSAFTTDQGIDWSGYSIDVSYATGQPNTLDAERLELNADDQVLIRHLVKYADNHPVQLQRSVMPLYLVEDTPVADPANQPWPGGTLAELRSVGARVSRVHEEARCAIATPSERRALALPAIAPVWHIVRIFYTAGGMAVEASEVTCPGDRVALVYETELSR